MISIRLRYLIQTSMLLATLLVIGTWFSPVYAKAIGHKDGTSVRFISEYKRHDIRVTSVCAEGFIVLVAHSDVGQGGGLQMLQLQHEVNGKLVPMTCDLNDFAKEDD